MTSKLLRDIAAQDQAELAARHNSGPGPELKQAGRKWCVTAVRPFCEQREYDAGVRLLRECGPAFPDVARTLRERIQGGAKGDYGMAARMSAVRTLENIRQAVRSPAWPRASHCVEWIVQMWTLSEVASAAGMHRSRGPSRPKEPDTRPALAFVSCVLFATADYFDAVDADKKRWADKNRLDSVDQSAHEIGSL